MSKVNVGPVKSPLVNALIELFSVFEPDIVSLLQLEHMTILFLFQLPFRFLHLISRPERAEIWKRSTMKRVFILCLLGAALFTLACKSHYCLTFTLVDGAPNVLTFCNLTWTDCKSCLTTKCILKVKILFSFTNLADIGLKNGSPIQPPRQAFAWNGSASFSVNTFCSGGNEEESKERRLSLSFSLSI